MNDGKVFFIGAGASKQDGFPLTNELRHGIAWAIRDRDRHFQELAEHLRHIYYVDSEKLKESAEVWNGLRKAACDSGSECRQMPDVIDMLSTLDWIIREQSSFGPGLERSNAEKSSSIDNLPQVRDLVVQALCHSFVKYRSPENASTTKNFIDLIGPADSLITTNWDLLLDAARHNRFGTKPEDYVTTGNVVLEDGDGVSGETEGRPTLRPKLLKLHGSLSWRYCQRCQRLEINPLEYVAGDRERECLCTYKYSELMVTPGFVREYRNVHLLTIWREALVALATASHWIFIGYSLPADDVGVRTLLLKARCVREDLKRTAPRVTVVTGSKSSKETLARYQGIFRDVEHFQGNFEEFVKQKGGGIF